MYLSSRDAARRLAWPTEDGRCGLTRNQADRLLASGAAGPPMRIGRVKAFDEVEIDRLAGAEDVPGAVLDAVAPLICRLGPGRSVDLSLPWTEQAAQIAPDWQIPLLTRILMGITGPDRLPHPLVATVSHHVVFGAEIIGWSYRQPPQWGHRPRTHPDALPKEFGVDLQLRPPGAWFAPFEGHRVTLSAGNPWILWGRHVRARRPAA